MREQKRSILFVCVENSCRSQIAEAFANIHGGDLVDAFSAGSRPSGRVNPVAVKSMKEIGYDLTTHTSKSIGDLPNIQWDFVATMGCGDECPLIRTKRREDWQIADPKDMSPEEFRAVRDEIRLRVREALAELQANTTIHSSGL